MKINVLLEENDPIFNELKKIGIEIDQNSEYYIIKRNNSCNYIPAKFQEKSYYINVKDIIYIESMGHRLLIHTSEKIYNSIDSLKQMEQILDSEKFIRISNSVIIAIDKIKKIESLIFQKFVLHMLNNDKVDVTRTYYYIFKEKLGL